MGALLTNLSKVFDCLPHFLFIAKLKAYGFDNNSVNLVNDYLSHRSQRTKIGNEYRSWKEIISGIPQGLHYDHSFLISTYVIFSSLLKNFILPTLQMTIHQMLQETIFLPLLNF